MSADTPNPSPVAARQAVSGLEYFRMMAEGLVDPPAMISLLGLRIVEVEKGRVVFVGTATEQLGSRGIAAEIYVFNEKVRAYHNVITGQ